MNLSKIHHIAIIVSDYEAAKDFYVNKLDSLLSERTTVQSVRTGSWIFVSMSTQNWRFLLRKILRSV